MPADPLTETHFGEQVADAYAHLYDLVYLRTHPLAEALVPDPALSRKDRAWKLHNRLLQALEELDPGPGRPPFSHEWRLYRLLTLHYVDGLDPDAASDQLGISRRHYYREHKKAIEAVTAILWDSYRAPAVAAPAEPASRLELLRQEAARMAQAGRMVRLADLLGSLPPVLQPRLQQQGAELQLEIPPAFNTLTSHPSLVRQVLLATLGYLIERSHAATLTLAACADAEHASIEICCEPALTLNEAQTAEFEERLAGLEEMAALGEARLTALRPAAAELTGFHLHLAAAARRTVLVVDDNQDVLELFSRYLSAHHYRVITAASAPDASALAARFQPYVIVLDLMMPGQDGWDLLQSLLSHTGTRTIPIVVCSVLKQKELALSLGASAFLEKPVSERDLVETVTRLAAPALKT